jgi:hypothetical protein
MIYITKFSICLGVIYRYTPFFNFKRQMVAWIGSGGMKAWPPRSPDLSPQEFSLWEYVKDKVFVPPFSRRCEELRQ